MNKHGDSSIAIHFLNRGNQELEDEAHEWATKVVLRLYPHHLLQATEQGEEAVINVAGRFTRFW
jgi:hypothetical protein